MHRHVVVDIHASVTIGKMTARHTSNGEQGEMEGKMTQEGTLRKRRQRKKQNKGGTGGNREGKVTAREGMGGGGARKGANRTERC